MYNTYIRDAGIAVVSRTGLRPGNSRDAAASNRLFSAATIGYVGYTVPRPTHTHRQEQ